MNAFPGQFVSQLLHCDERRDRDDQLPLRSRRQPARGKREHQVDEERLDQPAEDTACAIKNFSVGLSEGGERPRETRDHEELAEPRPTLAVPRIQADRDRGGNDRAAYLRFESRVVRLTARQRHRHSAGTHQRAGSA
jgi:hypothetical protein